MLTAEQFGPVDALYADIEIEIAVDAEFAERQQNTRRQPAPQQTLIHRTVIGFKVNASLYHLQILRAQRVQLTFQQLFEPTRRTGKERIHIVTITLEKIAAHYTLITPHCWKATRAPLTGSITRL